LIISGSRLPQEQWKSLRTTNAIERMHEEFRRRIKTQTASGQISMRKVGGRKNLRRKTYRLAD
jgi:putative transposase